jgi:DNA-directed RNA polymerase specialized sigma24 family protein
MVLTHRECEKQSAKEIAKFLDIEGTGAYVRISGAAEKTSGRQTHRECRPLTSA